MFSRQRLLLLRLRVALDLVSNFKGIPAVEAHATLGILLHLRDFLLHVLQRGNKTYKAIS